MQHTEHSPHPLQSVALSPHPILSLICNLRVETERTSLICLPEHVWRKWDLGDVPATDFEFRLALDFLEQAFDDWNIFLLS